MKFLNVFQHLHISIPLDEALFQMPKYAKFIKNLLTNKRRLKELEMVTLSWNYLAVIYKELPKKFTDPGASSFNV